MGFLLAIIEVSKVIDMVIKNVSYYLLVNYEYEVENLEF